MIVAAHPDSLAVLAARDVAHRLAGVHASVRPRVSGVGSRSPNGVGPVLDSTAHTSIRRTISTSREYDACHTSDMRAGHTRTIPGLVAAVFDCAQDPGAGRG